MFDKANLILASAGEGYGPWAWDHSGWYWSMMGTHGLFGLLLFALIVFALVYLVRGLARGSSAPETSAAGGGSARAALDARYARGEIDRDDYQQRKQDLT